MLLLLKESTDGGVKKQKNSKTCKWQSGRTHTYKIQTSKKKKKKKIQNQMLIITKQRTFFFFYYKWPPSFAFYFNFYKREKKIQSD